MEDTPYRYFAISHNPVTDGGERKALTSATRHGYAGVVRTTGLGESGVTAEFLPVHRKQENQSTKH